VALELAILLGCIVVGARIGGIALGTLGGLGLLAYTLLLGMPPGQPPATVLGMILAVITALAMMEAAGGLTYLVSAAERLLRRHPGRITVLAPLVTYALIFAAGTQHVIYSLLPVIAEVSRNAGVRPERPLSMSVIAAQHGLVASPVSAVTVALLGALAVLGVDLAAILAVMIPATLLGVAAGIISVYWRGAELAGPPAAAAREKADSVSPSPPGEARTGDGGQHGAGACAVFLGAVALVVLLGLFPALRPHYTLLVDGSAVTAQLTMAQALMIVMLAASGVITLVFKASPAAAVGGELMRGGVVAIISILGVSWMGSSFFAANEQALVEGISTSVATAPWMYAVGLFVLSILLFSQAATIVILAPVGVALGMPPTLLVGLHPAVNGNFFLPTYGTVLAAVSFDATGTTTIGRYLLNHSFMRPGLVTTATATVAASALAQALID
jgi:anaerobic C4-dicarboxylate transporter-like protein